MKKGFRSPLAMILALSLILSLFSGVFTVSAASNSAVLVTNASSLKAGDKIVIVALEYNFALGTTQNSNNRSRAAVTKSGNSVTFGSDTQVITLTNGAVSGSFGLTVENGKYLYAASSTANYLRTMDTLDKNGSWAISIDSTTGAATVTACGDSTRNHIRYNADFLLFSSYGAVTTTKQVSIYKINSSSDYYLFGHINGANYACEEDHDNLGQYKFVNGKLTVTFEKDSYVGVKTADGNWFMTKGWQGQVTSVTLYNTNESFTADKLFVPGGVKITFTLTANSNGTLTLSYTTGTSDTASAYYLFGHINGADYACEGDSANMGKYKFSNGKLTATFDTDSYVAVKTEGNGAWYMTDGWQENATSVTLYDTSTSGITPDKLRVPGGVKITFTLVKNSNGTLTLSYVTDGCVHSYTSKVTTAATCTKAGVTTYTCSKCGDSYTQNIAATGHTYSSKVTAAATCTAAGTKTFTCTKCGNSYTESIAATGHKYVNGKCSGCGKADPNCSHSYTSQVTTAATCTTAGVRTYTCSMCGNKYTQPITPAGHTYSSKVTTVATCTKAGVKTYTCIKCGNAYNESIPATGHSYSNGKCTGCGQADPNCKHSYTSKVTTIAGCTKDGVKTFTCSLCGDSYTESIPATGHNHISKVLTAPTCTTAGVKSFTCSKCGDNYKEDIDPLGHNYTSSVTKPTCTLGGYTTYTCSTCQYVHKGDIVSATGHGYYNGVCTGCGQADPNFIVEYYLCGHINGQDHACDSDADSMGIYKFVNGRLSVTFETDSYVGIKRSGNVAWFMTDGFLGEVTSAILYNINSDIMAEKMFVPGGVAITFELTENPDGTLTLSYSVDGCSHDYVSYVSVAPSCLVPGVETFNCLICQDSYTKPIPPTGHSYYKGKCVFCGVADPTYVKPDYYLFGYINDEDRGFDGGVEDLGEYKFVADKLIVSFESDCYVGVRTADNWYMTDGFLGDVPSGVLYNINTDIFSELMYIPGGFALQITIRENGDDTITLSYGAAPKPMIQPKIKLRFPTLSFKDDLYLNIYFEASSLQDVVDLGLITYSSQVSSWNINNAENIISGYRFSPQKGMFVTTTQGIPAKNIADDIWFAIYAELSDGSYYYTKLVSYSPATYAYSLLGSGDAKLDALLVSLLNYGAAAQNYFRYNIDNLANSELTDEQMALARDYNNDMMSEIAAPSDAKQGSFVNTGGWSKRYCSVSFKESFCINYFFMPSYAPVNGITMYYWDAADYNAAITLTPENATGVIKMAETGTGEYKGTVTGIAAKNMDDGIYVAFIYSDGTTTHASGVLPYSIGTYCETQSANNTPFTPFAKATAVYGYHAKEYFGN